PGHTGAGVGEIELGTVTEYLPGQKHTEHNKTGNHQNVVCTTGSFQLLNEIIKTVFKIGGDIKKRTVKLGFCFNSRRFVIKKNIQNRNEKQHRKNVENCIQDIEKNTGSQTAFVRQDILDRPFIIIH